MSLKSFASIIDENTTKQAEAASKLPFVVDIALMPDAHVGIGCCVGAVVVTDNAIVPSLVGVDIGCGMMAVETSLTANDLPDSLDNLVHRISRSIPAGVGRSHSEPKSESILWFQEHPLETALSDRTKTAVINQLGTLGSGNHFIEINLDERNVVWLMLHSGSRNVGNQLAQHYMDRARGLEANMEKRLEDPDLAYFLGGTDDFNNYIDAMLWAQDYAMFNRSLMMSVLLDDVRRHIKPFDIKSQINCHHNYATQEVFFGEKLWITRKGAINAEKGRLGIIPGSMGAKSYIVRGLGNLESYNSSPHGAGRLMSRGQAKRTLTIDSLKEKMAGKAWLEKDAVKLLDEHPDAYKPIDIIMKDSKDLVEVVHTLRQVANYKGV